MDDLERTYDRIIRGEEQKAKSLGYGLTRQGRALTRKYYNRLAEFIAADRVCPHDRTVWRVLKDSKDDQLAVTLLVAGIHVCGSDQLGTDKEGEKNYRDIALWIGRNFGCEGEFGFRVGAWGIKLLLMLPVFALDGADVLVLDAGVNDFMDGVIERAVINNPLLSPLASPPEPWTQVRKGGLPSDHWAKVSLIRSRHPTVVTAIREAITAGQMQKVLDAVNYLQSVPLTINKPVLEFMLRRGAPLVDPNLPGAEQLKAKLKAQSWDADMVVAQAMALLDRFYVPLTLDFRGRLYGISHFNFVREDHVRGLFLFSDGEPIGDYGLLWLHAYVAACSDGNSWSDTPKPSKLDYKQQLFWALENQKTLRNIGAAVLRGDDPVTLPYALPEKPCQFIAACVELAQAVDGGPDFVTRLPITMDATNSGMQHLCAMTRAEEGAYVNLVPSAAGDDLYKRVGDNLGLDRDLVKRPVMTYFYGSRTGGWSKSKRDGKWRSFGVTKQVADVLRERGQSIKGVRGKAVEILDNIRGMIPRAAAVRDFLETLARICSDNGKHLHWTSALGLPVVNCYNELNIKPLSVTLNGRRRRVNFAVGYKKEIKKTRAVNGATANFIHSCDACHLQMVALEAAKENIPVIPVHDCYGTLAPRALRLLDIVRQQFAQLHTRHNLLNEVRESVRRDIPKAQLPPLPEIGTLDPEGILAVNSPSILRRLKNTILTEAKNSKPPIDIEATADRDAVAQAVREANHGDIPDPPIKLGQLSDAEFREYTRKNFGF